MAQWLRLYLRQTQTHSSISIITCIYSIYVIMFCGQKSLRFQRLFALYNSFAFVYLPTDRFPIEIVWIMGLCLQESKHLNYFSYAWRVKQNHSLGCQLKTFLCSVFCRQSSCTPCLRVCHLLTPNIFCQIPFVNSWRMRSLNVTLAKTTSMLCLTSEHEKHTERSNGLVWEKRQLFGSIDIHTMREEQRVAHASKSIVTKLA